MYSSIGQVLRKCLPFLTSTWSSCHILDMPTSCRTSALPSPPQNTPPSFLERFNLAPRHVQGSRRYSSFAMKPTILVWRSCSSCAMTSCAAGAAWLTKRAEASAAQLPSTPCIPSRKTPNLVHLLVLVANRREWRRIRQVAYFVGTAVAGTMQIDKPRYPPGYDTHDVLHDA